MKRIKREIITVSLVLLVGLLTGVTVALWPMIAEGWDVEMEKQPNIVIIEGSTAGVVMEASGRDTALRTEASPTMAMMSTPKSTVPLLIGQKAEDCRQAAVHGRRMGPQCRGYLAQLGQGR